ncbi:pyrroline-5-carboxylate reductase [Adlercreutzia sp. R25]|uniref:Pyrroline-5-carboxylate reductase n=1 Tax=Adlercreutzia shanghongiae TaxID=3111773 RepID=A0ABU6IVA4_9ACTN|nr:MULTISPECIES: pyrroline-5-carboxylate reductase [unclassified Adlercreutzia]MEC4272026.1 pyrroline-5-carboxylate reductase [Adlercreutzia sp. R25]MEC4293757.1 pyrroline-5-carboxylate reductase [Adlercreutzia sp. R22]
MKIGFIGLGNMATAIIGGLLREGASGCPAGSGETGGGAQSMLAALTAANIIGSAKTEKTRQAKAAEFGIATTADNREASSAADVLVLAVKPVFFPEVIDEIRDTVREDTLVISIAAGLTLKRIAELFGRDTASMRLIRCMPNTPALVNAGCTAVVPGPGATEADEALCLQLMESFGRAIVIPERLMDAASAVAGSSPAFAFMFIEALADGAVAAGMPRAQAYEFAAAAVAGSAQLVLETGRHPGDLKDMVCSPGGTTIEGVRALEEGAFRAATMNAVAACVQKAKTL